MLIDQPMEEPRVYQGCSERPEDVDECWDRSLAERTGFAPG